MQKILMIKMILKLYIFC